MMILNPIVANLHNTATNRYHPILFHECPLPGPETETPGRLIRHKSKGHHTDGFDTRDEAMAECENIARQVKAVSIGEPRLCTEKDFAWDGEGVPAMVVFFGEEDGKLVPVLG